MIMDRAVRKERRLCRKIFLNAIVGNYHRLILSPGDLSYVCFSAITTHGPGMFNVVSFLDFAG